MLQLILWYIIITILGLLVFPLAYRLLPALMDRGYALSRILGLLLWGYLFWLLGSLGVLRNDNGGALFALLILVILSAWTLQNGEWVGFLHWIRTQRRLIITVETLFLLAFVGYALVRAANPDLVGTEKPMELAFINAILRSPTLPPNDPWLSGYTISYYYFGYILVTILARLVATPASVAFNLGISLVFALSAVGSYGILFNLLNPQSRTDSTRRFLTTPSKIYRSALLGPFFILITSNLGGFLHILRWMGVFWKADETGQRVSQVWAWLDIGRYAQPPPAEPFPHWWWWQASRIIQDYDFNWVNKGDIIDEFPFFSFLLADLHPHVLAMPFAFLAISLALNFFMGGGSGLTRWFGLKFRITPSYFLLASVVLGSLGFFNTWDFPFYVALFAGAYILRPLVFEWRQAEGRPSLWRILADWIMLGFAIGVSGGLLYLPFYLGFQSQAGGPLPNLIYITRGVYLWIHFIPLLVPILGLLVYLQISSDHREGLKRGIAITSAIVVCLLAVSMSLALLIANIRVFQGINPQAAVAADAFLGSMAAPGWWPLIIEGFARRLSSPGSWLTLFAILTLTIALLWPRSNHQDESSLTPLEPINLKPSHIFTLLLILIGALLVLVPEFVFLRDLFGYRINTIFKFYFQVWLLWGIAAAYAVAHLWQDLKGITKLSFRFFTTLILVLSLSYPLMGLWSKTNGFQPLDGFTLDGTAYLQRANPDESAAMAWLQDSPLGVVAEAVGGSYTQYARMAANSGQPSVLGWEFHEMQWRGGTEEMGSRRVDIERLYCTNNWDEAQDILSRYEIRYVVFGVMEQSAYGRGSANCPGGMNQVKFSNRLPLVFKQGDISIYQVPESVEKP